VGALIKLLKVQCSKFNVKPSPVSGEGRVRAL